MDSLTVVAARNNAEWCDLICRAHQIETRFDPDMWVASRRTPPMYPDAVTLSPYASARDVLDRVDGSPGCSVKDSFASLELSTDGFGLLFDAEWIYREPSPPPVDHGPRWGLVRTAGELTAWAAAHGGGEVFHADLLDDPDVVIVMASAGERLRAGAIGNRGESAVGVSNLFASDAVTIEQAWSGAVRAISTHFPGLPLVGYEGGVSLQAAHRAGFSSIGSLRVWLRG